MFQECAEETASSETWREFLLIHETLNHFGNQINPRVPLEKKAEYDWGECLTRAQMYACPSEHLKHVEEFSSGDLHIMSRPSLITHGRKIEYSFTNVNVWYYRTLHWSSSARRLTATSNHLHQLRLQFFEPVNLDQISTHSSQAFEYLTTTDKPNSSYHSGNEATRIIHVGQRKQSAIIINISFSMNEIKYDTCYTLESANCWLCFVSAKARVACNISAD